MAPFSSKFYYNAVVSGDKFAGETTITGETSEEYEKNMSDFFSTIAAKVDSDGAEMFVTFEPRGIAGVIPSTPPGKPLEPVAASLNLPNCPIHGIPVKQKNGRNGAFVSCSERNATGGYCNWKPA